MAHELDMTNGKAAMAFVGDRKKIWHGLGQELTEDASLEVWAKEAGMTWSIKEANVRYGSGESLLTFPEKKVLYRSDNNDALSIVSENYKVVQPKEVIEFFRDLLPRGMKLSTAGCLFGGRRFWALADVGKSIYLNGGQDAVKGFLLLVSSCDGTLATQAYFTAVRVVCNNTLRISLQSDKAVKARLTHRSDFDPLKLKQQLGLIDSSWDIFAGQIKAMSEYQIDDIAAEKFIKNLFARKNVDADSQPYTVEKETAAVMSRYLGGMGSEMTKGTLWGVLNGVTEFADHEGYGRTADKKLWSQFFDKGANLKAKAFESALELI